jgi:hypothetical protein
MYSGVGFSGQSGLGGDAWQWMSSTPDPLLVRFQKALNTELTKRGFKPIATDGKMGPGTCGAWAWLGTLHDVDFSANPDLNLESYFVSGDGDNASQTNPCKGFTYPTKVGGGVYTPPSTFSDQLPWCSHDSRVAAVQLNVNEQLDAHGYETGPTDGMMCEETCGGMKLASDLWGVNFMSAYGQNCKSFATPAKKAVAAPPPVSTLAPSTTPVTSSFPTKKTGSSQAWMVGGLIGAAALAGLYAATKKKK